LLYIKKHYFFDLFKGVKNYHKKMNLTLGQTLGLSIIILIAIFAAIMWQNSRDVIEGTEEVITDDYKEGFYPRRWWYGPYYGGRGRYRGPYRRYWAWYPYRPYWGYAGVPYWW